MTHLLTCLRGRDKERPTAFVTLGLIAVAIGPGIKKQKYLPKIMEVIKASLPTKVSYFFILFHYVSSIINMIDMLWESSLDFNMDKQLYPISKFDNVGGLRFNS